MDGKTVVLVGCGESKKASRLPAKEIYDSNYFDLKRGYAEAVADCWFIVSAEHGLLPPNQPVDPYDTHIDDIDIRDWEDEIAKDLPDLQGAHVVVLAGEQYINALELTLDMYAETVEYPTRGLSIGERMSWLKDNTPA